MRKPPTRRKTKNYRLILHTHKFTFQYDTLLKQRVLCARRHALTYRNPGNPLHRLSGLTAALGRMRILTPFHYSLHQHFRIPINKIPKRNEPFTYRRLLKSPMIHFHPLIKQCAQRFTRIKRQPAKNTLLKTIRQPQRRTLAPHWTLTAKQHGLRRTRASRPFRKKQFVNPSRRQPPTAGSLLPRHHRTPLPPNSTSLPERCHYSAPFVIVASW